jgi:hypothetical protein
MEGAWPAVFFVLDAAAPAPVEADSGSYSVIGYLGVGA